jgi:predicted DNA-binding antitoxin AbrB/MazE fold protein
MPKVSPRSIEAVYENGVFRPTRKVSLPDRSRVHLTLIPLPTGRKAQERLVQRQRKALLSIAGMGRSGRTDISENPHRALYGTRRAR